MMPAPKKLVIDKKGMDAIFSGGTPEYGVRSKDSGVKPAESEIQINYSGVESPEPRINPSILAQAIKQGTDNPRISSWNSLVMAVLRYKNLTTPAYSMSKEISELLETAVRERYPELSKQVEDIIAKK
jgi:hypothetical protein